MNTTTAATQANVTVATIRTWCRRGVITATKQAGRWTIDPASLARRIEIGARMNRPTTRYTVTTTTDIYGRPTWSVARTDGTKAGFGGDHRINGLTFRKQEDAETAAAITEALPDAYWVRQHEVRYRSALTENYWVWRLGGGDDNDPQDVRCDVRLTSTRDTIVQHMVKAAQAHAAGTADRIRAKAERDVTAAAEAAVREAREAQIAEARQQKGPLATPRQVDYILSLLLSRRESGEGGGFFTGPTDRAGIETLSKREASSYITSLKGDY
ncbi:helix-turn-helix domain-containing protein [Streptomyces sp. NPDC052535]|uniref:helix-turn-helix domain-containing protein n=1 Tax=Streptomyces sp. NPDC052535 TaxID=3155531 RepID=UPI00342D5F4B